MCFKTKTTPAVKKDHSFRTSQTTRTSKAGTELTITGLNDMTVVAQQQDLIARARGGQVTPVKPPAYRSRQRAQHGCPRLHVRVQQVQWQLRRVHVLRAGPRT